MLQQLARNCTVWFFYDKLHLATSDFCWAMTQLIHTCASDFQFLFTSLIDFIIPSHVIHTLLEDKFFWYKWEPRLKEITLHKDMQPTSGDGWQ